MRIWTHTHLNGSEHRRWLSNHMTASITGGHRGDIYTMTANAPSYQSAVHMHMRRYACAMNNSDALSSRSELHISVRKKRHGTVFQLCPTINFVSETLIGKTDAQEISPCFYFEKRIPPHTHTHKHTKALIKTPAWYMKNIRVCEVALFPAQGWFILD